MKKILFIILTTIILSIAAFGCGVNAENSKKIVMQIGSNTMSIGDEKVNIDDNNTTPVIVEGNTLVPVRAMIENLGGSVEWNSQNQSTTLKYENNEIVLTINNKTAYLNNEEHQLNTAPVIINGRTMLPIRFISESFGFNVSWNESEKTITIEKSSEKPLIVYYSRTGTTEKVAQTLKSIVGGDIAKIETVEPYTYSYDELLEIAEKELQDNARPEIKSINYNVENYDTIYIGYPIWWGTAPMAVFTFIENNDLSGKNIIPFCTSGSSGISRSESDIKGILPNSNVLDGFRGDSDTTESDLRRWIENIGE